MAENEVIAEKKKKSTAQPSLFTRLEERLSFDALFDSDNITKYFFRFVWLIFLGMIYIYNTHRSEQMNRERDALLKQLEDRRTHYTALHADVMAESKESSVIEHVKELGLVDKIPPYKIIVKEEK